MTTQSERLEAIRKRRNNTARNHSGRMIFSHELHEADSDCTELLAMVDELQNDINNYWEPAKALWVNGQIEERKRAEEAEAKLEAAEWERDCTATTARELRERMEKVKNLQTWGISDE